MKTEDEIKHYVYVVMSPAHRLTVMRLLGFMFDQDIDTVAEKLIERLMSIK